MRRRALALVIVVAGAVGYRELRRPAPREPAELSAVRDAFRGARDAGERTRLLHRASSLRDRGVARWLADAAQADPAVAAQASAALGAIADRAEAGDLVELATGAAPILVRANALRALGRTGGPREAAPIARILLDRGEPLRIRQVAALALGAIGETASAPALVAAIESTTATSDDGEQLRISAIRALAALGADARPFLAHAALSTTERAFIGRAAVVTAP
jgi:HEAT repeat protein